MSKLSIGVNVYKQTKQQDLAFEMLSFFATKFNCNIFNVTLSSESNLTNFLHLPYLKNTAKDVIQKSQSNKPLTAEIFDCLSNTDCEYFLFLNSDILLTEKTIKFLLKFEYESYIFSRIDIKPIDSLKDAIIPLRMEIAGFDCWCIKNSCWKALRQNFPNFVYGEPYWDMHYALTMYSHTKCYFGNKSYHILHQIHDRQWSPTSIEADYNNSFWRQSSLSNLWNKYVYEILISRKPTQQWFTPLPNELILENQFKNENLLHIL